MKSRWIDYVFCKGNLEELFVIPYETPYKQLLKSSHNALFGHILKQALLLLKVHTMLALFTGNKVVDSNPWIPLDLYINKIY